VLAVLRAQVLGVGSEVNLAASDRLAPTPALGGLIEALADRDSGLVLVVDEAQAASAEDFGHLASMVQRAVAGDLHQSRLQRSGPAARTG
jgi:hypothetical protein